MIDAQVPLLRRRMARRLPETPLRESEERYWSLLEFFPDGVLVHVERRITYVNPAAVQMLGATRPEQLVGKESLDFVHPDSREAVLARAGPLHSGARQALFEERLVRLDGTPFYAEVVSMPTLHQGKPGYLTFLRDITDRREAGGDYHDLFEEAPVGLYRTTPDGTICLANRALLRVLGYPDLQSLACIKASALYADPGERAFLIARVRRSAAVPGYEMRVRRHDGTIAWVRNSVRTVRGRDGKTYFEGAIEDITERKRAEGALRDREAKLQESEEQYRLLFDSNPQAMWVYDSTTLRFIAVNDAAIRHCGYSRDEFLAMTIKDIRPCADVPALLEHVKEHQHDFAMSGVWKHRAKDGSLIDVEVTSNTITFAGIPARLVLANDITPRLHAEHTLEERTRLAEFTAKISSALTNINEMPQLLRRCAEIMVADLHAAFARIWTVSDDNDLLELQASAGMYTHLDGAHSRVPVGRLEIGLIATERKPHLTNSVVGDPQVGDQEWARREGMVAFAGFPLEVENRVVGVIAMFARHPLSSFTLDALGTVANSIALGIERVRAEADTRRREGYYRSIMNHAPDYITLLDRDGRMLDNSPSVPRAFGYEASDLIGRSIFDFVDPDELATIRDYLARLLNEPSVGEQLMELSFRQADGSQRTAECFWTNLLHDPAVKAIVVNSRDITERKRLEKELLVRSTALNAAASAIMITDRSGKIIWTNPAFSRLTGYAPEEAMGQNPRLLKSGKQDPSFYEDLWRTIRSGRPWSGEIVNRRKDGTVYVEEQTIIPVVQADTITHFIAIKQDITERKESRGLLREALERATESDRLKSAFLANMSHEVRTPLNVITGFAGLIGEHLQEIGDHSQDELFEGLRSSSKRLIDTMHGVLDLSSVASGTFSVRPERIQLSSLLREQIDRFTPAASRKRLSLELKTEESDVEVTFDLYCLTRVVDNLLDNAIKFTAQGGVTVRLHRDASGALCLSIGDTGVGIDPSYAPHLFERFSQEESGYTRRFEGAGIGLALVKRYVEMNQAEISFQSGKGAGTTFTIRFAAGAAAAEHDRAAAAAPSSSAASAAAPQRPLVLVVEDDHLTQTFLALALRDEFDVLRAVSAEEARAHLAAHPDVAVVLMDLALRGNEDGLMLTRWLRAEPRWRDVPIIATTAHAMAKDRENALEAGCNAYLTKPTGRKELLATMRVFTGTAAPCPPGRSRSQ